MHIYYTFPSLILLLRCHPHKHYLTTLFLLWAWQACTWCTNPDSQHELSCWTKKGHYFHHHKWTLVSLKDWNTGIPLDTRGRGKRGSCTSKHCCFLLFGLQDPWGSVFRTGSQLAKPGSHSSVCAAVPHGCRAVAGEECPDMFRWSEDTPISEARRILPWRTGLSHVSTLWQTVPTRQGWPGPPSTWHFRVWRHCFGSRLSVILFYSGFYLFALAEI